LDAIRETYGEDLPIVVYGFSGGAHFVSRFVEWVPSRVVVWSAYSAQFWDEPSLDENTPPGIVACGEFDGSRWFPTFSYYFKGRQAGKPWTWVSIAETGHHRKGAFEQFVRQYFSAVLEGSGNIVPTMVDIDTE